MGFERNWQKRQWLMASAGLILAGGSSALAQDHDHNHDPVVIGPLAPWLKISEIKRPNAPNGQVMNNDMVMGSLTAKNTLLVYVSMSCGHCAHWFAHELPGLLETYVKPKKLKIVFRELLTNPVAYGLSGTVIARCLVQKTNSPKAYFETLSAFFNGQEKAIMTGRMGDALLQTKERTKTSQDQLMACMAENSLFDQVNATLEANAKFEKVTHTPYFIVNNKPITSMAADALPKALALL